MSGECAILSDKSLLIESSCAEAGTNEHGPPRSKKLQVELYARNFLEIVFLE